jgi:Immunity protein 50
MSVSATNKHRVNLPYPEGDVSSWVDLLSEPQGIRASYGDHVPDLTAVDLHEVILHRDGPRATLRLDLPEFPESPPRKWADQGFNVVQVDLMLVGVVCLSIDGWVTRAIVGLAVERREDVVSLRTTSGPVTINIDARALVLSRMSAYRDGH